VRMMLESGIELDDSLHTLRCKVDRRAYPRIRGTELLVMVRALVRERSRGGLRAEGHAPSDSGKLKALGKPA
jgi:hypothetical protein